MPVEFPRSDDGSNENKCRERHQHVEVEAKPAEVALTYARAQHGAVVIEVLDAVVIKMRASCNSLIHGPEQDRISCIGPAVVRIA